MAFSKITLEAHSTVIFSCIWLPFYSNKGLDLSFQEQKTESISLNWISFNPCLYSKNPKKFAKTKNVMKFDSDTACKEHVVSFSLHLGG
jgi:hypothetical protein